MPCPRTPYRTGYHVYQSQPFMSPIARITKLYTQRGTSAQITFLLLSQTLIGLRGTHLLSHAPSVSPPSTRTPNAHYTRYSTSIHCYTALHTACPPPSPPSFSPSSTVIYYTSLYVRYTPMILYYTSLFARYTPTIPNYTLMYSRYTHYPVLPTPSIDDPPLRRW